MLAFFACTALLEGCSASSASQEAENSVASLAAAAGESSSGETTFEEIAAQFDESALDLDYSKRDLDASYDAASATTIALSGTSATVSGSGASVSDDGATVIVSAAGTYVVTGELTDGQLVVEAGDDDKVQLVLSGATINNADGPAIYVKNADKCFVTLADGTQNTLTDRKSVV